MTEKMEPRDANHPSKNGQDSFLIICSYQSSLPFLSVGGGQLKASFSTFKVISTSILKMSVPIL